MSYQSKFNELSKIAGNRYYALQQICKSARQCSQSVHDKIRPSEAISWALSGEPPARVKDGSIFKKHKTASQLLLEDTLSQIENKSIRDSVTASYDASLVSPHLVYVYDDSLNQFEQARVRIIMNMLWSRIKEEEK